MKNADPYDHYAACWVTLLYKLSQDIENVNRYRPEFGLRTSPKVKIIIEFTDKEKVRRSSYYICYQLSDKIDSATQSANNMFEFSIRLRTIDVPNFDHVINMWRII